MSIVGFDNVNSVASAISNLTTISNYVDTAVSGSSWEQPTSITITDDLILKFDGFEIKGEQLKICMKTLLEISKEKHPEDFI